MTRQWTTLLLGLGKGVAGADRPILIDGPIHHPLDTAHVRLVDVDPITDEVIAVTIEGTGGLALAGATTHFGDLVLEVGVEQGNTGVKALMTVPQQADLFTHASLGFEVRVTDQHAIQAATTGDLTPVGRRHSQVRGAVTGRYAPFQGPAIIQMPDAVEARAPVRAVILIPIHAGATGQGKAVRE